MDLVCVLHSCDTPQKIMLRMLVFQPESYNETPGSEPLLEEATDASIRKPNLWSLNL